MKNNKEDVKSYKIECRLSFNEKEYIKQKAASNGYSNVSEYTRITLITPQKSNYKLDQRFLYEINKIGVNLMQLTRLANTNKFIRDDFLQAIETLREEVRQAREDYKNAYKNI